MEAFGNRYGGRIRSEAQADSRCFSHLTSFSDAPDSRDDCGRTTFRALPWLRSTLSLPGLLSVLMILSVAVPGSGEEWSRWRGPNSDTSAHGTGLFDGIQEPELAVSWRQDLGTGYSSVSVADGRAITAYSDGETDFVVAFDADAGDKLWQTVIGPTYPGHDGSHTGPIATPAVHAGKVFMLGPWGSVMALDAASGAEVWRVELVDGYGAVKPHYGFSSSPVAVGEIVVVAFGSEGGQALAGFEAETGALRWRAAEDGINYQSPILIQDGEQSRVLAMADRKLFLLESASGRVVWEYEHGGDPSPMGGLSANPVPIAADRLFLTHKEAGSVLLERSDGEAPWREVWSSGSIRGTYDTAVAHEGHLYGYSARFLTSVDAATGATNWKSRRPGDGFVMAVDGHLVIVAKKGSIHLAKAAPEGYEELSGVDAFSSQAWGPASVARGRIFARSMAEIVAFEVREGAVQAVVADAGDGGSEAGEDSIWRRFQAQLEGTTDGERPALVDELMASIEEFPLVEGDTVHFLYRGQAEDVSLAGDLIGARNEVPLDRLPGTDLFHLAWTLEPDARVNYQFSVDFAEAEVDPRNPRVTATMDGPASWFGMPGWSDPEFLAPPPENAPRGRIETAKFPIPLPPGAGPAEGGDGEGEAAPSERSIHVYLPAGYDASDAAYPVAYFHGRPEELDWLRNALDNLVGSAVRPLIAVLIDELPVGRRGEFFGPGTTMGYVTFVRETVVPYIDATYRTLDDRSGRASIGQGFGGLVAAAVAFHDAERFGKLGTQSMFMLTLHAPMVHPLVPEAEERPFDVYLDWGAYDLRSALENWDAAGANERLRAALEGKGHGVNTRVVPDGHSWASWRQRLDELLGTLFPLEPPLEPGA